jgi:hypothetical protein
MAFPSATNATYRRTSVPLAASSSSTHHKNVSSVGGYPVRALLDPEQLRKDVPPYAAALRSHVLAGRPTCLDATSAYATEGNAPCHAA